MDGTAYVILSQALPWVFLGLLFLALHLEARRRGGSIWKDIGHRGWAVALLTMLAATLFTTVVVNGLQTASNVPLDWTWFLIQAPIYAAVAVLMFMVARREFLRSVRPVS